MNLTHDWLHQTVRARFDSAKDMEAFLPQVHTPAPLEGKADGNGLSAMLALSIHLGADPRVTTARKGA